MPNNPHESLWYWHLVVLGHIITSKCLFNIFYIWFLAYSLHIVLFIPGFGYGFTFLGNSSTSFLKNRWIFKYFGLVHHWRYIYCRNAHLPSGAEKLVPFMLLYRCDLVFNYQFCNKKNCKVRYELCDMMHILRQCSEFINLFTSAVNQSVASLL